MKNKKTVLTAFLGILISFLIFIVLLATKYIPNGNDIWGHMYKADFLYDQIKQGNLFPKYSADWYNGIQLFRYWPIGTYYIIAAVTFLTKDIILSYYVFLAITFAVGYFGWLLIAKRENKNIFIVIGILWWFLPDTMRVTFYEGNLSRVFFTSLLPLFLYFFTNLIERKKDFVQTALMVFLLANVHFMISAMSAIIFCIYSLFSGIKKKTWHLGILAYICGFLMSGITLLPGVSGGVVSDTNSATVNTMADWSNDLFKTIFSLNRIDVPCSFGIFMTAAAILVVICGRKKAGSIISLIFLMLTDTMFVSFLMQMPLSQVWWMARFMPMCYALIIYEFAFVDLNKKKCAVLSIMLIIDLIPSYTLFTKIKPPNIEYTLFDEAVELTDSRLAIIDESAFGSYPSYQIYKKVPYMQGWAIQGAATKDNLVNTTESFKTGYYNYGFRNCLELGCDSVVVSKKLIAEYHDEKKLFNAANYYGYKFIKDNDDVYLFDNEKVETEYGTEFEYDNIAIGRSSGYICYLYPSFKKGVSDNLDDYSIEELLQYKKIYLSNFDFEDYSKTEEKIKTLSDAGIEIYIDSTHLPINYINISEIFNIEARFVNTKENIDILYGGKEYKVDLPYEWNATYLYTEDDTVELYSSNGLGCIAKKDNITVLGFNLLYMNIEEKQSELEELIDNVFNHPAPAPTYSLYKVVSNVYPNEIIISAEKECTTSIAWQDNFKGDIEDNNNLVKVNTGETKIKVTYKYFILGLIMSLSGAATTAIIAVFMKKDKRNENKENINNIDGCNTCSNAH